MRLKHETISELYRKVKNLNRSFLILSRAYYQFISSLIPEVRPTKKELKAIKRKEKLVPFSKISK